MLPRVIVLLCMILALSYGQEIPQELDAKISKFYEQVKNGEIKTALEDITQDGSLYSKIFGDEVTTKNFVNQIANLEQFYGKLYQHELVKEQSLGRMYKLTYFFYYEKHVGRFVFTYYDAQNEWKLVNFVFDDSVLEEF